MKTESIKAIENLSAYLSNEKHAAQNKAIINASELLDVINTTFDYLERITRIETPAASKAKFDIFKYVDKNEYRPALECVCFDDGFKVASNSHVLTAIREDFDPAENHTMINKKGEKFYDKRFWGDSETIDKEKMLYYPKWREVIPSKNTIEVSVNLEAFQAAKKDYKENARAYKLGTIDEEKRRSQYVKCGPAYFNMNQFDLLAAFMAAYGTNVLRLAEDKPERRAAMAKTQNGDVCLIMPVMNDDGQNFKGYII